jgi:hypothetical protein
MSGKAVEQGVQGRHPKVVRKMMNAKWQGAKTLHTYGIAGPYRSEGQLSFLAMRRDKNSHNFDLHNAPLNSMAVGNPHLVVHMIFFVNGLGVQKLISQGVKKATWQHDLTGKAAHRHDA